MIILSGLEGLIQGNRWSGEFLFDPAKSIKARLELEVVIRRALGYGGDNGDIVAFGANIMGRRNNSNVNIW